MPENSDFHISIDPKFHSFIPAALLRLGYIYPQLDFVAWEKGVKVRGDFSGLDLAQVKREVLYQVYREKIFQQTLPLRQNLYKMLSG